MTMITFGQSAIISDNSEGQSHDANWIKPIPTISWNNSFYSGMSQVGESQGHIYSNAINVTAVSPAYYSIGELDLSYGTSSPLGVEVQDASDTNGVAQQVIMLLSQWNSIKDIEISSISSHSLMVGNFVDTWINVPGDNEDHSIDLEFVKRGAVALGDGNNTIQVNVFSNDYTWPNHFDINAGDGNNAITVQPEPDRWLEGFYQSNPNFPGSWKQTPQLTTAAVTVGGGDNTIRLAEVSGTIHVGSGNNTINITDGDSSLWLGSGNNTVTIGTLPLMGPDASMARATTIGTSIVHIGSGHADVAIDNANAALTPAVTLDFTRGETGGNTSAGADVLRFGHSDTSSAGFIGGDLRALTLNFAGYSPGSTATLAANADGNSMLLQMHDAGTGSIDAVSLYGDRVTSAALLNLHFL